MKILGTTRSKVLLLIFAIMLGIILVACNLSKLNGFLVNNNNSSDDIEFIKAYLEGRIWTAEESYCVKNGTGISSAYHIIFDYPKVYAIPITALTTIISDGLGTPVNPSDVPSSAGIARLQAGTGLDLGDTCSKAEAEQIQDILIMKRYISTLKTEDLIVYLKTFGATTFQEVTITESNYGLDLAINKNRTNLKYLFVVDPSQINNHAEFYYLPYNNTLIYPTTIDSYLYNRSVTLSNNSFFNIYE